MATHVMRKGVLVKRFYLTGSISGGLYYKSFAIVIYDRNDNGLYYKTTIIANLALARSVNYDHKGTLQFAAYLTTFIVQDTGECSTKLVTGVIFAIS
jgi:hypothetical protein